MAKNCNNNYANKEKLIDYRALNSVLSVCDEIQSHGIFSDKVREIIKDEGLEVGISEEYAMAPIFAAVSALAKKSTIKSLKTQLGCSVYYGLVAPPSSGKSAAIGITQQSIVKMERFLKIESSMLISTPTNESLQNYCATLPAVLSIFDEGASFFGQLGRHSGNKELDRGLFNTLWTCPVLNSRDTISNQVRSESPRFNLCFATHADVTMRLLNGDKCDDDGFTHRLLLHAPPDECRDARSIMQARTPLVKLHNIFLFIHLLHMVNRRYEFSEEAERLLMCEFDKYQILKQRSKRCDYGLLSGFGKNATLIVRHAMILQILHVACHYVSNIQGCGDANITPKFHETCLSVIETLPDDTFIVSDIILERAITLTDYFNKHKLVLSGYHIDPLVNIHTTYDILVRKAMSKLEKMPTIRDENNLLIVKDVLDFMQVILLCEHTDVYPRIVDRTGRRVADVRAAMDNLVYLGLGTTTTVRAKNGKPWQHFHKIKHAVLSKDPLLITKVQNIGLDIDDVLKSMLKSESRPVEVIEDEDDLQRRKRPRDASNADGRQNVESSPYANRESARVKVIDKRGVPNMIPRQTLEKIMIGPYRPGISGKQTSLLNSILPDEDDSGLYEHEQNDGFNMADVIDETDQDTYSPLISDAARSPLILKSQQLNNKNNIGQGDDSNAIEEIISSQRILSEMRIENYNNNARTLGHVVQTVVDTPPSPTNGMAQGQSGRQATSNPEPPTIRNKENIRHTTPELVARRSSPRLNANLLREVTGSVNNPPPSNSTGRLNKDGKPRKPYTRRTHSSSNGDLQNSGDEVNTGKDNAGTTTCTAGASRGATKFPTEHDASKKVTNGVTQRQVREYL